MHLHNATAIRLFAAWCVLFGHCPPLLGLPDWIGPSWGHVGLGIFFALSGHLVSASARRSPSVRQFAMKRIRRLVPAYLLVAMLTVLVLYPWLTTLPSAQALQPRVLASTLLHVLAGGAHWELPGTFQTHAHTSANGSVWSLPYEALMYALLAAVWYCGAKRSARPWLLPLALWVCSSIVMAGADHILPGPQFRVAGFRILYVNEFLAFFAGGWTLAELSPSRKTLAALSTALLLLRLLPWPGDSALAIDGILFPAALVLIGKTPLPWLDTLPDWSYGFYLWAWPVQQVLIELHPHITPASLALFATLGTLPCAAISWHFVERPFLKRSIPSQSS